jgi:hypothetical protein
VFLFFIYFLRQNHVLHFEENLAVNMPICDTKIKQYGCATFYHWTPCNCSELCEVGVLMSSQKGAQLIWRNPGGSGNWNGEGMGREWGGGGQFTSNLGPGWTRIAPRKRRDSK